MEAVSVYSVKTLCQISIDSLFKFQTPGLKFQPNLTYYQLQAVFLQHIMHVSYETMISSPFFQA